ncbi:hypothetical protein WA026_005218 [Henosepilachna vigintioctopunctata]|uniref:Carboxylesterase type B domain-containing protein n=1 Tax=Henosepilachna vigintioctopunctata TaxID=420089 RepID=A0AAW1UWS3_9CUCU
MFYFRCCFILLFVTIATCDKPPQVQISLGNIEGKVDRNVKGGAFYSFEGVPYADPPIGKLRFEEPVPSSSWKGTWKADTRYKCIQYDPRAYPKYTTGTEDCLYLNIYTPKLKGKLDVMSTLKEQVSFLVNDLFHISL